MSRSPSIDFPLPRMVMLPAVSGIGINNTISHVSISNESITGQCVSLMKMSESQLFKEKVEPIDLRLNLV